MFAAAIEENIMSGMLMISMSGYNFDRIIILLCVWVFDWVVFFLTANCASNRGAVCMYL